MKSIRTKNQSKHQKNKLKKQKKKLKKKPKKTKNKNDDIFYIIKIKFKLKLI